MSGLEHWMRQANEEDEIHVHEKELRIVLVGKTGAGKSSSGNTILGKNTFFTDFSPCSATKECQKEKGKVDGRDVAVIDTPGIFDTTLPEDKYRKEITSSISLMAPGPHVFLVVMELRRFTPEEKNTINFITDLFSNEAAKYTMVLFTRADELREKSLEEFIAGSAELRGVIKAYGNNYHAFNNRESEDRTQVRELLRKIDKIVKENGGGFYTNAMLHEAEKAIWEKKQEILKKEIEKYKQMKLYEEEQLKRTMREQLNMKISTVRAEAERENAFNTRILMSLRGLVEAGVNLIYYKMRRRGAGAGETEEVIEIAALKIEEKSRKCCVQ